MAYEVIYEYRIQGSLVVNASCEEEAEDILNVLLDDIIRPEEAELRELEIRHY